MELDNTTSTEIASMVQVLRETYESKVTLSYEWRLFNLNILLQLVQDQSLSAALYNDIHRSKFESNLLELSLLQSDIVYAINHLDKWMEVSPVGTNLLNFPGKSYTRYDPLGLILIMSPWNYPLLLTFQPLIGAIAAGNVSILRPANYSAHVSSTIAHLVNKYFNNNNTGAKYKQGMAVGCVLGDRVVTEQILSHRFDYIFFTGGAQLGKIVLAKAAPFLTPTTLELGGKSPAIVDASADIDIAAKRLVWASFVNSGQTCVRPDYCFVHNDVKNALIEKMKYYILEFYTTPTDDLEEYHILASASISTTTTTATIPATTSTTSPNSSPSDEINSSEKSKLVPSIISELSSLTSTSNSGDRLLSFDTNYGTFETIGENNSQDQKTKQIVNSPYFGRIINDANFNRLVNCLRQDAEYIQFGGLIHPHTRFISPTLIVFPENKTFADSTSMQEELFGPLFPIVGFNNLDEPINFIRSNHKPLAAYCFTTNDITLRRVQTETSSGSLVFNDAIVQLSNHELPFSGVGASGFGAYHGFFTFATFSHKKAVLKKYNFLDVPARYPPYTLGKRRILRALGGIEGIFASFSHMIMFMRRKLNKIHWFVKILLLIFLLVGVVCGFGYLALPAIMKGMKNLVENYYK